MASALNSTEASAAGSEKRKFEPSADAKDFFEKLTKREAAWLLHSVICFVANYTICRLFPMHMTFWLALQIAVLAVFFLWLTIWLLWTQINAVDVATRDETPFDDKQASNDMGWLFYPIITFLAMVGIAVIGFVLSLTAQDLPPWVHQNMYLSWPIIVYAPSVYVVSQIDRGVYATLYQRVVSLKMRITRLEQGQH